MSNISLFFNRMGLQLRKHSPEILMGAGIVGAIASAVLACKATTKLESVMEKSRNDIKTIHEAI